MKVFGVIVMIIGFLLFAGAGLCTIIFGGAILSEGSSGTDVWFVVTYGGVPMIVGALIAWSGYALWRSGAPK
jgi:hypothetical protein